MFTRLCFDNMYDKLNILQRTCKRFYQIFAAANNHRTERIFEFLL